MANTNEASADNEQTANDQSGVGYGSTATKAIAAAAATGAVTFAVRRALSHRGTSEASEEEASGDPDRDEQQEDEKTDESSRRRMSVKKDDLTETLSSKVSEVKKAAGRLRPSKDQSIAAVAWNAASDSLLPFAEQAAATAGKAAAEKAPAAVRDTLIPRFIEAFEESH